MVIRRGSQKFGVNGAHPLYASHLCCHAKFGCFRSNRTNTIMEICQKLLTSHVLPLKVTQGHWNWHGLIGYLWLPIWSLVTVGLSCTISEIQSDICKMLPLRVANVLAEEVPLDYCNGAGAEKLEWSPTRWSWKCDHMCIQIDTILADGWTGGQNW